MFPNFGVNVGGNLVERYGLEMARVLLSAGVFLKTGTKYPLIDSITTLSRKYSDLVSGPSALVVFAKALIEDVGISFRSAGLEAILETGGAFQRYLNYTLLNSLAVQKNLNIEREQKMLTERSFTYDLQSLQPDWAQTPLWPEGAEAVYLEFVASGLSHFFEGESGVFWKRWLDGFQAGQPISWALQLRIASISDSIWNAGPKAVAKEIARIEAEWEAEQDVKQGRVPELEPDNVVPLFQYPQTVVANVSHVSTTITQNFELFRQETGLNQTPEMVLPLEAMVASLDRIGDLVAKGQSAANEQALKEEIGRLYGRIVQLEAELAKAKKDLELQKKPWFVPMVKTVGACTGAVIGAAWILGSGETRLKTVIENLTEDYRYLQRLEAPEVCAPHKSTKELPFSTDV